MRRPQQTQPPSDGPCAMAAWVLQLLASLAWVGSLFVYDSWGGGDALQVA